MKHPNPHEQTVNSQHWGTKWAALTYNGNETRKITKLFKKTQINITFRKRNTIQKTTKPHSQRDKYERSGIYQMKWLECPLKYIGQTGRIFHGRLKVHMKEVRTNKGNLG